LLFKALRLGAGVNESGATPGDHRQRGAKETGNAMAQVGHNAERVSQSRSTIDAASCRSVSGAYMQSRAVIEAEPFAGMQEEITKQTNNGRGAGSFVTGAFFVSK